MYFRELFPGELERIEYLSLSSPISLEEMCDVLVRHFDLPLFEFGGEDETEYAFSLTDGIEYNITRARGEGPLRIKGEAMPDGSNFSVAVLFHEGRPAVPTAPAIVASLSQALSDTLNTAVSCSEAWLWDGARHSAPPLERMKIIVRGIDKLDLFVNQIAPSILVDVAYVSEVTADGAVVFDLDPGLGGLPLDSDKRWFQDVLVAILKDEAGQTREVSFEFT